MYKDILTPEFSKMAHAGMSRLIDHMVNGQFAIISAENDGNKLTEEGRAENKKRDAELRDLLRTFNIGFINIKGSWLSEEVGQYLTERSLFVPNIKDEQTAIALAKLYNQEAYVFGNGGNYAVKGTNDGASYMSGNVMEDFKLINQGTEINEENVGFGYSQIKNKNWQFRQDDQTDREDALVNDIDSGLKDESVDDLGRKIIASNSHPNTYFKMAIGGLRINKGNGQFLAVYENPVRLLPREIMFKEEGKAVPDGRLLDVFLPLG